VVIQLVAGPEEAKNLAGRSPPPDSDPFSETEFGKILARLSRQFPATANRRFEFQNAVVFRPHGQWKSFESPRCASAIQSVRPSPSTAARQP